MVLPMVFDDTNEESYLGDKLGVDEGLNWTLLGGVAPTAGDGGNWAYENGDAVTVADVEDLKGISFLAVSDGGEAHIITIDDVDDADDEITFKDETKGKTYGPFDYTGGSDTFDLGFMDIDMTVALAASFDRINDYAVAQLLFDTDKGAVVEIAFDTLDTTFQIVENGDGNAIDGIVTFASDGDLTDPEMDVTVNDADLMCGTAASCELSDGSDYDVAVDADTADNLMSWGAYFKWNSADEDEVTIVYPEDQTIVKAFVSEELTNIPELGGLTSSGNAPTPVEDTDWASAKVKNVIVVGGSGINMAAADLLGLTYPTYGSAEAWQTATGISGPGMAVVKMMDNPYATGKYAMLVAGWDGIDTQKAALALKEGTPALTGMTAKMKTSTATVELMA